MDELQARATNETLVGEALAPLRDRVGIATKSGFKLDPTTGATIGVDSRPDHIAPVRLEIPILSLNPGFRQRWVAPVACER
jgi:hypothetical protein